MVVRKPIELPKKSDDEIDKLISKGAKVKEDSNVNLQKKSTFLNFRIPSDILEMVDELVKKRPGMSRNAWMIEALHEKIQKENIK